MESLVKRTIAVLMVILMSFSVIAYVGNSDFTVSAASAKTISIKKKPTVKASNIKATTVKLKWSRTKNATSYRVYRSTDKKKWTLVAKTKKTSYTVKNLKGNKKYYFKVRAYNSNSKKTKKSPYSKVITVKTKKNETVYATKNVKIRAKASTKSKALGTLKKGKSIKRTAATTKGWSKVVYNGKTGYIKTKYLTTKKPSKTPTQTSGGIELKPITSSTAKKISENTPLLERYSGYEGKSADGKEIVVYAKTKQGWIGFDKNGAYYLPSGEKKFCAGCGAVFGNGKNMCQGECVAIFE